MRVYNEVIMVPIDEVKPYWNNPRINEKTRVALVEVFKKVGFNQPILIDKKGTIVKGHARYYAARISKFKEIPCLLSLGTDKQNKEDRILDNKIQELTEWDKPTLEAELRAVDMNLSTLGWNVDADIDLMANAFGAEAPGEEPEVHMVCPECGEEFKLKQSDILAMEDWNGETTKS